MEAPLLVLAGVGLLSVGLLIVFAIFVIGIQRCDHEYRGFLFNTPRCYSDALTRRVLVGVRYPTQIDEENDL